MNNLVKMSRDTTKIEKKVKKHWLFKVLTNKWFYILVFWIFTLGFVGWFFSNYTINFPIKSIEIKYQKIIQERKIAEIPKKRIVTPVAEAKPTERVRSEFEIVQAQKHGDILWNIYLLETGRGKNDYCRKNGTGFGGFGVMNGSEVVCYPTFEKAVERAEYWLAKLEPEKSLVNALCSYNLGTANAPYVNCSYYLNYISL